MNVEDSYDAAVRRLRSIGHVSVDLTPSAPLDDDAQNARMRDLEELATLASDENDRLERELGAAQGQVDRLQQLVATLRETIAEQQLGDDDAAPFANKPRRPVLAFLMGAILAGGATAALLTLRPWAPYRVPMAIETPSPVAVAPSPPPTVTAPPSAPGAATSAATTANAATTTNAATTNAATANAVKTDPATASAATANAVKTNAATTNAGTTHVAAATVPSVSVPRVTAPAVTEPKASAPLARSERVHAVAKPRHAKHKHHAKHHGDGAAESDKSAEPEAADDPLAGLNP